MAFPSVLFVDDEPSILAALQRGMHLTAPDWPVRFVGNAVDAIRLLASEHIDVLVSDLRMPTMSGSDLTREVLLRYPWVVRIILSGMVDEVSIATGSRWSERYLTKPCALPVICEEIRQAIARREQDRALVRNPEAGSEHQGAAALPMVLHIRENHEELELIDRAFVATASRIIHERVPHVAAALERLARPGASRPDVILLDLDAAPAQGYEFLSRYRLTEGAKVPVMVMSTSLHPEDRDDALRHGAASCLITPRSWDQYLDVARAVARFAKLVASRGDAA